MRPAARLGWRLANPKILFDSAGKAFDLSVISGPLLQRRVEVAVENTLWASLAARKRAKYGPNPWDVLSGGAYTRDLVRLVRRETSSGLDSNQLKALSSAHQGREWPQVRRHKAFGGSVPAVCLSPTADTATRRRTPTLVACVN